MPYSAALIANFFLTKARQSGQILSPMKLIKLVYLAHGWHLGLEHKALIDEPVVAWQFGPVIESLYHTFKRFGNEQITELAPVSDEASVRQLECDKIALTVMDRVWQVYGDYTAIQLSNLTHKSGSPWDVAWNKEEGKNLRNRIIQNIVIQDYFAKQAARHKS